MEHYFTNNQNLKSEIRKISYSYFNTPFLFYSDLGVFSKNKIDYGSDFMLKCYLEYSPNQKRVLDMGCGYGFIGIVISKLTGSFVTLVDVNKRAIHLTNRNIEENEVNAEAFRSDVYENVVSKYDVIITNPPIRAGKEKVLEMLINAKNYLNQDGELWFVIRKDQGVKSICKVLEEKYIVKIVDKSKGFYVVLAKCN